MRTVSIYKRKLLYENNIHYVKTYQNRHIIRSSRHKKYISNFFY